MSFFSQLSEIIGEKYSVQITVQKKGGKLSVSVVPTILDAKDETAKKTMVPVVATGPADQIDLGLIAAIASPLNALNELVISGDSFTKESKTKPKPAEKPKAQQTLDLSKEEVKDPPKPKEEPKQEPAKEEPDTETFDEDTGEVMSLPAEDDADESPFEGESTIDPDPQPDPVIDELSGKPIAPAPEEKQGEEMFDEEEW